MYFREKERTKDKAKKRVSLKIKHKHNFHIFIVSGMLLANALILYNQILIRLIKVPKNVFFFFFFKGKSEAEAPEERGRLQVASDFSWDVALSSLKPASSTQNAYESSDDEQDDHSKVSLYLHVHTHKNL